MRPMSAAPTPRFGIVLGGGRSQRMGTDKLALILDGRTLLDRVVDALLSWADEVVVAGPQRPGDGSRDGALDDRRVRFRQEDPPFGGPVAGLAAALAALPGTDATEGPGGAERAEAMVLAGDLVAPEQVVTRLAAAELGPDGVTLLDPEGWPQYLAGRYLLESLRKTLSVAPRLRDISVNRVMRPAEVALIPADAAIVADVDTPQQARSVGIDAPN